jgi:hypothetical protein
MNLKVWWQDIGKGYRKAIGSLLAASSLAAIAAWAKWGRSRVWSEKEVSTIRLVLLFLGLGLVGLNGWIRFWQIRKANRAVEEKLGAVEKKLAAAEEALRASQPMRRHFLDNFSYNAVIGLYRNNPEKDGHGWLCGKCLAGDNNVIRARI